MHYPFFTGLIAPAFTPFKSDGSLNLQVIPSYAEYLKKEGLKGVFVCGSTGEGLLMTSDERKKVVDGWLPYIDNDFRLLVHVGSTSYEICRDLASHASSVNAHAVSCMGPCFFQPKNVYDLTQFCARVASAAPDTPFYYYHIPALSGVNLNMKMFLVEAGKVIPNLSGLKFTSPDFMNMFQCMGLEENRYDILHGQDQTLICGLTLGIKGMIGTTFNFLAPIYLELLKHFQSGNIEKARENQRIANEILSLLHASGSALSGGKAIMKWKGMDFGPCREPITNLTDDQMHELRRELTKIDEFI